MSNVVLSSLHLIVLGTCDTGGSTPHLHVALPIGCMPSPKTSRPSLTAGELTVGSFRYGVLLLQATRLAAFGSVSRQKNVGTLKLPSPETKRRSPKGTGAATKCSVDGRTQSTRGVAGPGT